MNRRFGREALVRLVQPLVGGIYTSDPERLSLAATMPRFLEMERDHGSLIFAALHQKWVKTNKTETGSAVDTSSGARYGLFAGLKGGMQELVDALSLSVDTNCNIRFQSKVVSITSGDNGSGDDRSDNVTRKSGSSGYILTFSDGTKQSFSGVIIAVSAVQTADIVHDLDKNLCDELRQIEYASSAIVVSGHRLADIQNPLRAFGLVIPHVERRRILAVSFSSRKFPERAPSDRVLLRTFVGGALQPELLQQTDEDILKLVREELKETLGVGGEPDFMQVVRYERAMPQYHVGHLGHVEKIEELTRTYPGLAFAGIACRGVGVPDAIASGERAAEEIVRVLSPATSPRT